MIHVPFVSKNISMARNFEFYPVVMVCIMFVIFKVVILIIPFNPLFLVYHLKCIDPWLTKNRRVCPVCKAKVVIPGMTETDSESEVEPNVAANERTPLIPEARGRGRRQRRRRRREGQINEGNSGPETDQVTSSPIDVTNSSTYNTQEEGLPSTSGHLSINCDVREGEEQQTATASSEHPSVSLTTSVVVSVEVEPGNSSSSRPSNSSRGRRRSDAIV